MKIVSWNVNSVRARKERLLQWLQSHDPDVLCLQELKCQEPEFPRGELLELGYQSVCWGQKSYNGVAIIAKGELLDVRRGFPHNLENEQSRIISALFNGIRIVCVYVPNGQTPNSEAYFYKLEWLARLKMVLDQWKSDEEKLVLCGDFNIAPLALDIHDPDAWNDEILCTQAERDALTRLCDWGLRDTYRNLKPDGNEFSWWDYRKSGFQRNHGLRIDHVYVSNKLIGHFKAPFIDKAEREGEKPSDHAPVGIELF